MGGVSISFFFVILLPGNIHGFYIFFRWFKDNIIHICNKLLALGDWIRHNLKDKIRNRINIILIAEKSMKHLVIRSLVIIYIYCEDQWIIRQLVMSNNSHDDEFHCVPMSALIGIFVDVLASMIRLINGIHYVFSLHCSLTIVKKVNKQYFLNLSYVTVNEKTGDNEILP